MTHQVKKNMGVTLRSNEAEFRVWAPFAKAVSIAGTFTPDGAIELTSEDDGYWSTVIRGVEPGHNYKYFIETEDGRTLEKNDPRALTITSSDKGFSVITDNEFDWEGDNFNPPPKNMQIMYELHIGTFNRPDAATPGTFDTAIERIPYLKDLGINMVELMPVTSMAFSNGWGYAPNYIYSVESMLGGRYGLMKFVRECHKAGIGVVLDVVYNHFYGDTDLWQFDGWSENNRGGIYFYNDHRGDTPWGGRPDYGRPEVRQFILDNITMWLTDYHLDGMRIDSTNYMRNTEGRDNNPTCDIPDAWYLLQDINKVAHEINPNAIMIAEDCANTPYIVKPQQDSGAGFDAQWALGFPHAMRDALVEDVDQGPTLAGARYELEKNYEGNAFNKVVFSDSHDTAANGSARLYEELTPKRADTVNARRKSLLADALMLTAPGIPMLLQGAEFLQEGAFNDWQALEWDKVNRYKGFVEAHKHLIQFRLNAYGTTAGLAGQSTAVFHQDDNNHVIGFHRWQNGGPHDDVLIIANFSGNEMPIYNLTLPLPGKWVVRFNSSWKGYAKDFKEIDVEHITVGDDCIATTSLPPYGIYILSQDQ